MMLPSCLSSPVAEVMAAAMEVLLDALCSTAAPPSAEAAQEGPRLFEPSDLMSDSQPRFMGEEVQTRNFVEL